MIDWENKFKEVTCISGLCNIQSFGASM